MGYSPAADGSHILGSSHTGKKAKKTKKKPRNCEINHGEHGPDEHPDQVVDQRLVEQPRFEPLKFGLQPSRLFKLLLHLLHCRLQPLLQPLLQLLEDDRAELLNKEEENKLLEQCLEL